MPHSILIVDDESHITHVLGFKLGRAGYVVTTADNGQRALEKALDIRPALVITDYQMPLMSGLELATALRETAVTADIPVIMVTARGHKLTPRELDRTNIRHLLPKPFSPRELLGLVDEVLEPPTDARDFAA